MSQLHSGPLQVLHGCSGDASELTAALLVAVTHSAVVRHALTFISPSGTTSTCDLCPGFFDLDSSNWDMCCLSYGEVFEGTHWLMPGVTATAQIVVDEQLEEVLKRDLPEWGPPKLNSTEEWGKVNLYPNNPDVDPAALGDDAARLQLFKGQTCPAATESCRARQFTLQLEAVAKRSTGEGERKLVQELKELQDSGQCQCTWDASCLEKSGSTSSCTRLCHTVNHKFDFEAVRKVICLGEFSINSLEASSER